MKLQTLLLILQSSSILICCTQLISLPLQSQQRLSSQQRLNSATSSYENNLRKLSSPEPIHSVLANLEDLHYTVQVFVGKNKTPLNLEIDTGSNDLWIATSDVKNIKFESYYDCVESDDCIYYSPPVPHSLAYAKGKVSGNVGIISLAIGNLDPVTGGALLANEVTDIAEEKYSGLIGLGPQNSLSADGKTWIERFYEENLIPKPQFSVYLTFSGSESELTLGGINTEHVDTNEIMSTFTADLTSNWWTLPFNKFQMGSVFSTSDSFKGKLVIDSGFSLIGTDESIWDEIYKAVNKIAKTFLVQGINVIGISQCSSVNFPNLTFTLPDENGKSISYDLEPNFYLMKGGSDDQCILPFQKMSIDGVTFAVGQVFLRKYLTSYSYSPPQIQIVKSVNEAPTDNSSSNKFPAYAIVLICFGVIILILAIIYAIYRYCKDRKYKSFK